MKNGVGAVKIASTDKLTFALRSVPSIDDTVTPLEEVLILQTASV